MPSKDTGRSERVNVGLQYLVGHRHTGSQKASDHLQSIVCRGHDQFELRWPAGRGGGGGVRPNEFSAVVVGMKKCCCVPVSNSGASNCGCAPDFVRSTWLAQPQVVFRRRRLLVLKLRRNENELNGFPSHFHNFLNNSCSFFLAPPYCTTPQ
jgi:hypothetical protein